MIQMPNIKFNDLATISMKETSPISDYYPKSAILHSVIAGFERFLSNN